MSELDFYQGLSSYLPPLEVERLPQKEWWTRKFESEPPPLPRLIGRGAGLGAVAAYLFDGGNIQEALPSPWGLSSSYNPPEPLPDVVAPVSPRVTWHVDQPLPLRVRRSSRKTRVTVPLTAPVYPDLPLEVPVVEPEWIFEPQRKAEAPFLVEPVMEIGPATKVHLAAKPSNDGRGVDVSIRLSEGSAAKPDRAKKTRVQAFLHAVNSLLDRTWGPVSEALDVWEAFAWNAIDLDTGRPMAALSASEQIRALREGDVSVDWYGFVIDLAVMEAQDRAIGWLARREVKALNKMPGQRTRLFNPSTGVNHVLSWSP